MMRSLPYQPWCPVCGDPNTNPAALGLRFALDEATGTVFGSVRFQAGQLGYAGRVHGGVVAMVLDEAMAWACAFRARSFCTTGELKLKLKAAVPPDQALTVKAWVEEARGPYLRARGELVSAENALLVTASGTFAAMPREESLNLRRFLRFQPQDLDVLTGLPFGEQSPDFCR